MNDGKIKATHGHSGMRRCINRRQQRAENGNNTPEKARKKKTATVSHVATAVTCASRLWKKLISGPSGSWHRTEPSVMLL